MKMKESKRTQLNVTFENSENLTILIISTFASFNSSCPEDQEYAESLYTRDLLSTTPFFARMIQ